MQLQVIADRLKAELHGDGSTEIKGVSSLSAAGMTDLAFVGDERYLAAANTSAAAAIIVPSTLADVRSRLHKPLLLAKNPRLAFALAAEIVRHETQFAAGVHASADLDLTAAIADTAYVGPNCYVGPGVTIGARTRLGPGCVVLGECSIGADCELVARVTVYPKTKIADRVTVHAGAVLGSDGFGFVRDPETGRYQKFPQIGRLEIGSDVEIGANVTIDRGALEATVISDGVKLDNMVHVGHNAVLGENVVIAAQTGVSGSSVIERDVLIGGQVGIADHVRIEEGAILGAQCGVPSKKVIRGKGVVFWGTPARPISEVLRELAALARLARRKRE